LIGGPLVKYVYNDNAIFALVTSGVSFWLLQF
jgi:maltose/moltooligosaccharide transporter